MTLWQSRHVLSEFQASEASRTINTAIDDYHHNKDRRHPSEDRNTNQVDSFDQRSVRSDMENEENGKMGKPLHFQLNDC